jgi:hypothetical protein
MAHDSVKPIRLNKHESIDTIGHLADRVLRAFQTSEFAYPEGRIIGIEEQLRRTFAPGCPDFEARIDLLIETDDVLRVTDFKTSRHRWNDTRITGAIPSCSSMPGR